MLRDVSFVQTALRSGLDRMRQEIGSLQNHLESRRRAAVCRDVKYQLAALRFETAWLRHDLLCRKAGFRHDQPRWPKGTPGEPKPGGRWSGGAGASGTDSGLGRESTSRVRLADASRASNSVVMNDASPEPIISGAQYAQTQIVIKPSAVTDNPKVNETTVKLTTLLGHVMDIVGLVPGLTPQEYGRLIHERFADSVRVLGLPGIAYEDVETTFGGSYYGDAGSVRTDVVLRDEAGKVIAIYDVKTGDATISARRAAELRLAVGVDNSVPIIELQAIHGVVRKGCVRYFSAAHRSFPSVKL